jgi:arylformamidase
VNKIWDISLPLSEDLTRWPGHPPIEIKRYRDLGKGESSNSSALSFSVHTGTHVDAPVHFLPEGDGVEKLPLSILVGPCLVVETTESPVITEASLERLSIAEGTQRILFKTQNSALWKNPSHEFRPDYISLSDGAAQWLVKKDVRLVGVDYLSVQRYRHAEARTHHILLGAGITIVEGLNLNEIVPGNYQLVCLPLKLVGADGAPARAILF